MFKSQTFGNKQISPTVNRKDWDSADVLSGNKTSENSTGSFLETLDIVLKKCENTINGKLLARQELIQTLVN